MPRTDFIQHAVPRNLGTREIIAECLRLIGPDEYGRIMPQFGVIHLALTEYRDKLRAAKKPKTGLRR